MKFFGVIEADSKSLFMMNMPILGLCLISDGRFCIGRITGDLNELQESGHVSYGYKGDFKEWLNELKTNFPPGDFPDKYETRICSYKEACARALELYEDTMKFKAYKGSTFTYNMIPIKNKLRKVLESE